MGTTQLVGSPFAADPPATSAVPLHPLRPVQPGPLGRHPGKTSQRTHHRHTRIGRGVEPTAVQQPELNWASSSPCQVVRLYMGSDPHTARLPNARDGKFLCTPIRPPALRTAAVAAGHRAREKLPIPGYLLVPKPSCQTELPFAVARPAHSPGLWRPPTLSRCSEQLLCPGA